MKIPRRAVESVEKDLKVVASCLDEAIEKHILNPRVGKLLLASHTRVTSVLMDLQLALKED